MHTYIKLSSKSQLLISELNSQNKGKQLPVTIALARLMAYALPLPTAEVEDIVGFLKTQHGVDVQMQLTQLNEVLFIDTPAVSDYITKFYTVRYAQVCSCKHVLLKPATAVLDLFKITRSFDAASLACIEAHADYINRLTNGFIQLLDDLAAGV